MAEKKPTTEAEFRIQYSLAMEEWQHVEYNVFFVFKDALWTREDRIASIVYNSMHNFNARMSIIKEVVKYIFGETGPLSKEWDELSREISKCREERNELAHWSFIYDYDAINLVRGDLSLVPTITKPKLEKAGKALKLSDLDKITGHFKKTGLKVWAFRMKLSEAFIDLKGSSN